jgi:hypothetical protein
MRVRAKYSDCKHLKESSYDEAGYSHQTVIKITKNIEYEVYAVAVFKGRISLQIINDVELPTWLPINFFELCDDVLPQGWVCNFFEDDPKMVMGPEFVSRDLTSYSAMVTLEPEKTKQFWERVKRLKKLGVHKEVLAKLKSLVDGKLSRDEIALWARSFSDSVDMKGALGDTRNLVDILMGVDAMEEGKYLYDEDEIEKLGDLFYNITVNISP